MWLFRKIIIFEGVGGDAHSTIIEVEGQIAKSGSSSKPRYPTQVEKPDCIYKGRDCVQINIIDKSIFKAKNE